MTTLTKHNKLFQVLPESVSIVQIETMSCSTFDDFPNFYSGSNNVQTNQTDFYVCSLSIYHGQYAIFDKYLE